MKKIFNCVVNKFVYCYTIHKHLLAKECKAMRSACKIGLGVLLLLGLVMIGDPAQSASGEDLLNVRIVGAVLGAPANRSHAAFAQSFMKEHPGVNVDILPGGAVGNNTRIQRGGR